MKKQGKGSRLGRAFIALLLFALILVVVAFGFASRLLCIDSGPVRADALVVLGGDSAHRPQQAAELFRAGAARMVLVSGGGDCRDVQRILVQRGVPESAIVLECDSGSTQENAEFSADILRKRSVKRAIIVTSWFHSRRALKTFQEVAPELQFYSRPEYFGAELSGLKSKKMRSWVGSEYLKLAYYWYHWGVRPF